ncbi:unnamed protein product [Bursaphelenchus okinawaensis]|uniref:Regulator of microtubule dynamics protein 1 n=1 Tax=Bursaphelenchus okinawaensis TaxID=465554 RepID=A0A811LHP2_9BILA|nr:unnamed protein product [Bursaphelenchus okinawaensis]CAG9125722.1 unnamed protein product [Bursaphelenchus okinawaensis]
MKSFENECDEERLLSEALQHCSAGHKLNPKDFNCILWTAIVSGALADRGKLGNREKIQMGHQFLEYLVKAATIEPDNAMVAHMKGRYYLTLYSLDDEQRSLAKSLYSVDSFSTLGKARSMFEQAAAMNPSEWIENMLFLGKTYLALDLKGAMLKVLEKAVCVEPKNLAERKSQENLNVLEARNQLCADTNTGGFLFNTEFDHWPMACLSVGNSHNSTCSPAQPMDEVFNYMKASQWRDLLRHLPGKLDELLFLHSGTLFLLLFNRFEGLSLHSLWRFETQNSRFTKHSDINHQIVAPGDENTYGSHLKLVEGNQFNIPAPYFIVKLTNLEYEFVVFHLEIAIGHTVSEILKRVKSLQPVINAMDPHPVSALYYQNNIYITVAERGCGLKWKTDQIIKFDINEKTLQPIDVSTELFVLALPRFDFYYPISNQWLHFGSTTKNENGNNTIFVLKDITRSPHWIKYELPLDDVNFTDHFLTTDTSNVVTVLRKDAVYQFDINYLQ